MPRRKPYLITDEVYHVFNRGINKEPIFREIRDYKRALDLIKFYSINGTSNQKFSFSKFLVKSNEKRRELLSKQQNNNTLANFMCFCLMPNHFHFLLQQKIDGGISKFMHFYQNSYAKYFNIKYNRIGPIFQGSFRAVRVEDDEQLLHLSRYIHLNPYSAFIVKDLKRLENYQWSSLSEYTGNTSTSICNTEDIILNFNDTEDYKKFVFDYADDQKELNKIKHMALE